MDFEFETQRTGLANAFAAAGADLLDYIGIADTAVAAIPDTQPEKYAIAGTLPGILQMAGQMMGEEGNTGLEGLTRYDPDIMYSGCMEELPYGDYVQLSDVERLLAARADAKVAAWIDEFGNVWPLGAYSPTGKPSFHDAHKRGWKPLYRAIPPAAQEQVQALEKHLPGWERGIATVTLTGHQLRAALDCINPDGDEDTDQLDESLTFGIVQHKADGGTVSTGMCCWNDDTDGVLPLDGEYTAAPASQEGAHAALEDAIEAVAKVGCEWVDDSNRDTVAPILNEAISAIRALQTPACAERSGE